MGVHKTEVYDQIKDLLEIPRGEPIFILRAQDDASVMTLDEYEWAAEDVGATKEFRNGVAGVRDLFVKWRSENTTKVPD